MYMGWNTFMPPVTFEDKISEKIEGAINNYNKFSKGGGGEERGHFLNHEHVHVVDMYVYTQVFLF